MPSAPDFVAIGHVTLDRMGDATRPGGGALYAAITAHRLGLSVGLLTSHAADFPLDAIPSRIEVVTVDASETTRFEHRYAAGGRVSHVRSRAAPLSAADVPEDWLAAPLVLLAPVLDEVDPRLAVEFSEGAVGAAAQGWLRDVGRDGLVAPRAWESPQPLLSRIQTLFLSREDVRGQEAAVVSSSTASATRYGRGRPTRSIRRARATSSPRRFSSSTTAPATRGARPPPRRARAR